MLQLGRGIPKKGEKLCFEASFPRYVAKKEVSKTVCELALKISRNSLYAEIRIHVLFDRWFRLMEKIFAFINDVHNAAGIC